MLGTTIIAVVAGHRRHDERHGPRERRSSRSAQTDEPSPRAARRERDGLDARSSPPAAATSTSARRRARSRRGGTRPGRRRGRRDHRAGRGAGPDARGSTEPRVTLFAADPARMAASADQGARRAADARRPAAPARSTSTTTPPTSSRRERGRHASLRARRGRRRSPLAVRDVVTYRRHRHRRPRRAAARSPPPRRCSTRPGQVKHVLVSNTGGETVGRGAPTRSSSALDRPLAPLGPRGRARPSRTALEAADEAGNAFMSLFTTFGSFSIAAGILLIFLIFVMLAAERRTRDGHRPRGRHAARPPRADVPLRGRSPTTSPPPPSAPLLGIGVSYAMVRVMARRSRAEGLEVELRASRRAASSSPTPSACC